MVYCSECGSHNDESRLICEICGHDLSVTDEMVTDQVDAGSISESTPTNVVSEVPTVDGTDGDFAVELERSAIVSEDSQAGKPLILKEKLEEFSENTGGRLFSQEEMQLGKGLIKPTNIQLGIDGYHFSYEKQNPHFIKAESFVKEGTTEMRVVNPDVTETSNDMPSVEQVDIAVSPEPATEKPEDENLAILEVENQVEPDETKGLSQEALKAAATEFVQEEEPELGASEIAERPIAENEGIEPEDQMFVEVVKVAGLSEEIGTVEITLLAGRQTWFGVPLPSTYRITNRAVVVADQTNQTHQISLDSISEVSLHQSLLGKLLGIGNVKLKSKQTDIRPLAITGVTRPKELVKKIESLIK